MGLLVDGLEIAWLDTVLNVIRKVFLVLLGVFFLHLLHVVSDVLAIDAVLECLFVSGLVLLGVPITGSKALTAIRDEEAAVGSALEGTENDRTGGRAVQTDIKEADEGAIFLVASSNDIAVIVFLDLLHAVVGKCAGVRFALELACEILLLLGADLSQKASGNK